MPGYAYSAILPHRSEARLLLIEQGGTWTLPGWEGRDEPRPYWQDVGGVNRGLRERYYLDATTLRCLSITADLATSFTEYTYLIAPPPDEWVPSTFGHWHSVENLARLPFTKSAHRDAIRTWLAERESPGGPPWYSSGWFGGAVEWIDEQLVRLGRVATGPVEQLRSWERSCVLRVPTTEGLAYFKAVPQHFAHEVPLLLALTNWHPGSIPRPLAVDQARHWWLVDNFDGRGLDAVTDPARWEEALAGYAALQVASVARRDALLALGCPDFPLARLPDGLLALLADERVTMHGDADGLTTAEIARLHTLAPQVAEACIRLEACGIPVSLEHGGLWASNIIARFDGGYHYIDWSDSAVAHPFFSLFLFLEDAARVFPAAPQLRLRLRDRYLAAWIPFIAPDRAHEAFELSQLLAPLHHALTYHQRILPAMWRRWEMERMVPFYLRHLLTSWDEE